MLLVHGSHNRKSDVSLLLDPLLDSLPDSLPDTRTNTTPKSLSIVRPHHSLTNAPARPATATDRRLPSRNPSQTRPASKSLSIARPQRTLTNAPGPTRTVQTRRALRTPPSNASDASLTDGSISKHRRCFMATRVHGTTFPSTACESCSSTVQIPRVTRTPP
ncbi:hypothetical protein BC567DRAFT_44259 [Phyllosticta citribraziliensis]